MANRIEKLHKALQNNDTKTVNELSREIHQENMNIIVTAIMEGADPNSGRPILDELRERITPQKGEDNLTTFLKGLDYLTGEQIVMIGASSIMTTAQIPQGPTDKKM